MLVLTSIIFKFAFPKTDESLEEAKYPLVGGMALKNWHLFGQGVG